MKTNSTTQSLARKVTLKIVFVLSWLVIFPIIVAAGVIDIVTKQNPKVNANTRIASDQSKIVPKIHKTRSNWIKKKDDGFTLNRLVRFNWIVDMDMV